MRQQSFIQLSTTSTLQQLKQTDPQFKNRSAREQAMLVADRLEKMLAARV